MDTPDRTNLWWPNDVSVLIPAYKAGRVLTTFLPELLTVVPKSNICIVDDGSYDDTGAVCEKFGIAYLTNEINRGKGAALRKGFSYLLQKGTQWIITMDADGQHAVKDLTPFINASRERPDAGIIIGARSIRLGKMPPARIFSNTVTSALVSLFCGVRIRDSQCGYRIYSAALLKNISLHFNRFEMESEVILKSCKAGFPVLFVPVQTLYCSTRSHISHILDMIRWVYAVLRVWVELHGKKSS
jgi:glycosyltransferase involved in cell wall biosynthesis